MRRLVMADIHANIEALEAVLADAGTVDGTLCLGDLIDYGPNPNECVELTRSLPNLVCLVGNHDLAGLGAIELSDFNPQAQAAARWTTRVLSVENRQYLKSLQADHAADTYHLAHASPRDPVWEYLETAWQARENFSAFAGPLALVGHTHIPRAFWQRDSRVEMPAPTSSVSLTEAERWIINPGGVGQPRDGDPRAAYGIWDDTAAVFEFRRIAYPLYETQRKILAANLPPPLAYRLAAGL